jgi:hypothetical protein
MAEFSRVFIENTNQNKVAVNYDFAYGEYLATKTFFDLLSDVQQNLLDTGKVILSTGQEASADSPGGLLAIQFYMEAIESSRQAHTGLSQLGLNVEKQLWKNI